MMPSRGALAFKSHGARLLRSQYRGLSSAAIRRLPQIHGRSQLRPSTALQQAIRQQPILLLPAVGSIRFASTTPSPAVAPSAEATSTPAAPTVSAAEPFPNLDTITLDSADFANVPEKIGYLHEIGINYGYGPTSAIQWILEHIHVYSGMPWWGSIATTAVLIRLCMFPLFTRSSDTMARQQALSSITKPITDKMNLAKKMGNTPEMMASYQELAAIRRRAGIRMRDQFAPLILQGVLGYCGFKLMRAMAALPVPALVTDGPLWIQDLTVSDPYLILPVAMAGSIHLLVRLGGESGSMDSAHMTKVMRNVTLWVMPGMILVLTGYLPAAVNVWFAAGGTFAIMQSLLLRRPEFRQWYNLAPLYRPNAAEVDKGMLQAFLQPKSKEKEVPKENAESNAGKHAAYMEPTWQAPRLNRVPRTEPISAPVVDTTLVEKPSSDTIIPPEPVYRESTEAGTDAQQQPEHAQGQSNQAQLDPNEAQLARRKAAFERASAAYEEHARKGREVQSQPKHAKKPQRQQAKASKTPKVAGRKK